MAVEDTTEEANTETPAEPAPNVMDAINAALEPPKAPVVTPPADDTNKDGADEELETEGGEDGTDEDPADAAGDDQPRGADGKFKSPTDGKGKAGEGAGKDEAGKLGADGKPLVDDKGAAKKPDHVNDPIPKELSERTQERMQSLVSMVKEKDEIISQQHQLFAQIESTGATPQEFGAMVGYMAWVHSNDPKQLTQARDLLMSELRGVSLKLGEAAPGIDFLSDYPDLKTMVDNGQITTDVAQELAIKRTREKTERDASVAKSSATAATQAAETAQNDAIKELNALGAQLMQDDPDYARKHDILKPIISSFGILPPKQWKAAFMRAYNAIPAANPNAGGGSGGSAGAGGAAGAGRGTPLRGNKTPAGEGQKQPTSLFDAVNAALDNMS